MKWAKSEVFHSLCVDTCSFRKECAWAFLLLSSSSSPPSSQTVSAPQSHFLLVMSTTMSCNLAIRLSPRFEISPSTICVFMTPSSSMSIHFPFYHISIAPLPSSSSRCIFDESIYWQVNSSLPFSIHLVFRKSGQYRCKRSLCIILTWHNRYHHHVDRRFFSSFQHTFVVIIDQH